MSNLQKRLTRLEREGTGEGQERLRVLNFLTDGQVFDPVTETFYLDEAAFWSAIGKTKNEHVLFPMRHDCTRDEFIKRRAEHAEEQKAMLGKWCPGDDAKKMMRRGVSPGVAFFLEQIKQA